MSRQYYSFKLGDMAFTALLDGVSRVNAEAMQRRFPDVSEADARGAYEAIGLDFDGASSSLNVLIARVDDEILLIDTGEGGNPNGGALIASMALAGIAPDAITTVIITHSHGDHVKGILSDDGEAVFPNATYIISQEELSFWEARIEQGLDQQPILDLMRARGLRVIAIDDDIIAGVKAVPIIGHTPGQIGVLFESKGEKLIHLADLLHSPMQFAHPEWSVRFDFDAGLSVPTRRNTLGRVADEKMLAMFYHLEFPALGHVKRTQEAFLWETLSV